MRSLTRVLAHRPTGTVLSASVAAPCGSFGLTRIAAHTQRRFTSNMSESEMASQRAHVERLKQQQQQQQQHDHHDPSMGCDRSKVDGGDAAATSASSSASSASSLFNLSTSAGAGSGGAVTPEEAEQLWLRGMEAKYGEGTYQLFRPLYKDLCDEMRREYYTKPPPPFPVEDTKARPDADRSGDGGAAQVRRGRRQERPPPARTFGPSDDGDAVAWRVVYQPANNCVVFSRGAVPAQRQARVVAYSKVEVADPPKLNALLTFADWVPIEVMMERRGVVVHFSVACNEGGMHLRNVRAYRSPTNTDAEQEKGEEAGESSDGREEEERFRRRQHRGSEARLPQHPTPANVLDVTDDAEWCRQNLCYDGPCLWHLELDFLNELYDVMQDHGITLDWVRWAAEWVYYLEHASYARWSVGMLEELIPSEQRGAESDFLTEDERAALDEPAEDWLSARAI